MNGRNKHLLRATVIVSALMPVAVATAADLRLPPAAPAWTWSGFYIGGSERRCGEQRGYVVIVFGPDLRVPMRNYLIRSLEAAVCIACLAVASCVMSADSAAAQGQATSPAVKQIALTKTQIEGVIAAQKEMDEINEKVSEKPKPYLIVAEQFESAAKKNGFASYDEYTNVIENISIVLAGFDPTTKKYIGSEALIKAQIAQVQADKQMPPEDKTLALDELNAALKSPAPPVENKGNIDLVAAYYDKLAEAMGNDQQ